MNEFTAEDLEIILKALDSVQVVGIESMAKVMEVYKKAYENLLSRQSANSEE